MSAIESAVCLIKTTADRSETAESFHASEASAIRALAVECRGCGWSHTDFVAGEAIIYDSLIEGDEIIGTAQVKILGY